MEPLSALSIAGTVVQFVDFSYKFIDEAVSIYRSAAASTPDNAHLKAVTKDLAAIASQLSACISEPRNREEKALYDLVGNCQDLANELQDLLQRLTARNPRSKVESFRVAWESLRKRKEVASLQQRLDLYRSQIILQITKMMRSEQSTISQKLDRLIQESRSYEALPVAQMEGLRVEIKCCCESLQASNYQQDTQQQFTRISKRLLDLAKQERRSTYALTILKALEFDSMNRRHATVGEAHAKTFEWILEQSLIGPERDINNPFKTWLSCGTGIFYISGKAGSGKSTLMKFLCQDERTKRQLAQWAGNKTLIFAHFFFWSGGTSMQKSLEGLLRSLLFEVLQQCPERIPIAFPEYCSFRKRWPHGESEEISFTHNDIIEAFSRLVSSRMTFEENRFCFFIDGLDEHAGDHRQIVGLLNEWVISEDMKICISCRPWNVFEDSFPEHQRLRLQDLTHGDIEIYVKDNLENDVNFRRMIVQDSSYEILVHNVVERADGVFLWVYLATKSLLDGLGNDDRISDLQRRLEIIPKGLVSFFRHILNSVDPLYRTLTARMLMIAQLSPKPLPALTYSFLDELDEDPEFALGSPVQALAKQEIKVVHTTTRRRLDGRCKGLLEIRHDPTGDFPFNCQVEFLHRTVREFVELEDIQAEIRKQVKNFDGEGSLSHACLALFKLVPIRNKYFTQCGPLYDVVDDILYWARQKEIKTGFPQLEVIQGLEKALKQHKSRPFFKQYDMSIGMQDLPGMNQPRAQLKWRDTGAFSLVQFAASKGLLTYVSRKLEGREWPEIMKDSQTQDLLDCAVHGGGYKTQYPRKPQLQLVWYLFKLGASANERSTCRNGTVWASYAETFHRLIYPEDPTSEDWRLIEAFLRNKADPDVMVRTKVDTPRRMGELNLELSPTEDDIEFDLPARVQSRWVNSFDDAFVSEWRSYSLQQFINHYSPSNEKELCDLLHQNRTRSLTGWPFGRPIYRFWKGRS